MPSSRNWFEVWRYDIVVIMRSSNEIFWHFFFFLFLSFADWMSSSSTRWIIALNTQQNSIENTTVNIQIYIFEHIRRENKWNIRKPFFEMSSKLGPGKWLGSYSRTHEMAKIMLTYRIRIATTDTNIPFILFPLAMDQRRNGIVDYILFIHFRKGKSFSCLYWIFFRPLHEQLIFFCLACHAPRGQ